MRNPLVSIAMPVRNCEGTLAVAVRSILHQEFSDWELLLIDDGSNDLTATIASSFADQRIRVISDGFHAGLPSRLNQAVRLSRGVYFARMDGDDVAYPERLLCQVDYLEQHLDVDLLASSVVVFRNDGSVIGQRAVCESHDWICRRPWASFPMPHPTWMGKIEWFRRHPYNPGAIRTEDQELLLRTYQHSRFAGLPQVLLGYREDRLQLSNICRGRANYVEAVLRHSRPQGKSGDALLSLLAHSARLAEDVLAIGSGLDHLVLRHRARPVSAEVRNRWREVWANNASPLEVADKQHEVFEHVWHCH